MLGSTADKGELWLGSQESYSLRLPVLLWTWFLPGYNQPGVLWAFLTVTSRKTKSIKSNMSFIRTDLCFFFGFHIMLVTEVLLCRCYSHYLKNSLILHHIKKTLFNSQTYYMKNNSIKLIFDFIFFYLCVLFFTLYCNLTYSFLIPQDQDYLTSFSKH